MKVKIFSTDHYLYYPSNHFDHSYSHFRCISFEKIPVVRIYGSLENGYKTCCHVHGYFPYFYVECRNNLKKEDFLRIANDIDNFIVKKKNEKPKNYTYDVRLVKKRTIYGYFSQENLYLKITLNDPSAVQIISEIINSNQIDGCYQTFESHIPYHLKFLIDSNTFGMDYISIANFKFRTTRYINMDNAYKTSLKNHSSCFFECDFNFTDILNISEDSNASYPGLENLWKEEEIRRLEYQGQNLPPVPTKEALLPIDRSKKILKSSSELKYMDIMKRFLENLRVNDPPKTQELSQLINFVDEELNRSIRTQSSQPSQNMDKEVEDFLNDTSELSIEDEHIYGMTLHENSCAQNSEENLQNSTENVLNVSFDSVKSNSDFNDTFELPSDLGLQSSQGDLFNSQLSQLDGLYDSDDNICGSQSNSEMSFNFTQNQIRTNLTQVNETDWLKNLVSTSMPTPSKGHYLQDKNWEEVNIFNLNFEADDESLIKSQTVLEIIDASIEKDDSLLNDSFGESQHSQGFSSLPKHSVTMSSSVDESQLFQPIEQNKCLLVQKENIVLCSAEVHCSTRSLSSSNQLRIPNLGKNSTPTKKKSKVAQVPQTLKYLGATPSPIYDPVQAVLLTFEFSNDSKKYLWILVNTRGSNFSEDPLNLQKLSSIGNRKKIFANGFPKIVLCLDEMDVFKWVVFLVQCFDPDLLLGYDINKQSWTYLVERARVMNYLLFCRDISRLASDLLNCDQCWTMIRLLREEIQNQSSISIKSAEIWSKASTHSCSCQTVNPEKNLDTFNCWFWPKTGSRGITGAKFPCPGRVALCIWRLLSSDISLQYYSYENVFLHLFRVAVPRFSYSTLKSWYEDQNGRDAWRTLDYYAHRSMGNLLILKELDKVGRVCEFARIFGIEFYHVLLYGSQYRVESVLLRLTKKLNYICPSPTPQQRTQQRAPEMIPLNLEPDSQIHYDGPVIVLDFQSLYPSIAIAYNYCYSTCLGRLQDFMTLREFKLGCLHYEPNQNDLKKFMNQITISPSGILFLNHEAKNSILREIWYNLLTTRLMVKNSMKLYKNTKSLHRLLDSRQMGLKLLANVIYGYTGASFSGRMSCVEVADAIVGKGRETLMETIRLVNSNDFIDDHERVEELSSGFPAKVIYGDTDSIFVKLNKCSKSVAFAIADEIAKKINASNPDPVKIKVEKIYYPCVLEAKKRYAGYCYESPDQVEPFLESKGVETVRRDHAPFVSDALNQVFHIIFSHFSWDNIEKYNEKDCLKILEIKVKKFLFAKIHEISNRKIPFSQFLLSRPYRGIEGYQPGASAPALQVARRLLSVDINAEPCRGYRIRYYIVPDHANQTLISCVRAEEEAFHYLINARRNDIRERRNIGPILNVSYYVIKQLLPPLERCLSLINFNINSWISTVPLHNIKLNKILQKRRQPSGKTLSQSSPSVKRGSLNYQLSINDSLAFCSPSSQPDVGFRRNIMSNFIQKAKAADKCIICHQFAKQADSQTINIPFIICASCQCKTQDYDAELQTIMTQLGQNISISAKRLERYERICGSCMKIGNSSTNSSHCASRLAWLCSNFDCPINFQRQSAMIDFICATESVKYEKMVTSGTDSW